MLIVLGVLALAGLMSVRLVALQTRSYEPRLGLVGCQLAPFAALASNVRGSRSGSFCRSRNEASTPLLFKATALCSIGRNGAEGLMDTKVRQF